jgi:16S rRNA C967 or C1407 C5-methylase (RsmB/RsmF family)
VTRAPVRFSPRASLARPGGNITGNTVLSPDLGPKRLQILREALTASGVRSVTCCDLRVNEYAAYSLRQLFANAIAASRVAS